MKGKDQIGLIRPPGVISTPLPPPGQGSSRCSRSLTQVNLHDPVGRGVREA